MSSDRPESSGLSGLGSSVGPTPTPPIHPFRPQGPPVVPDHELLQLIGRGSYGDVWLARNAMGSLRAVKVVYRGSFDHDRPYEREFEGIRRFEPVSHARESQVDIFHVGINREDGYFYYIMELADNADSQAAGEGYAPRTLRSELRTRGALPLDECIGIGLALTRALDHLHAHGLVHRDVKPSNVIFVHGTPKLADIGLVTSVEATLSYVGTEGYIPPEGPGTPQADLYSLGKLLYEISTGRDRLDFPELPDEWRTRPDRDRLLEFNEILVKACDRDRRERYQTAAALQADLMRLQQGKSIRWHQRLAQGWTFARRAALGLALLALMGVLIALLRSGALSTPTDQARASVFVLPFRSEETNPVPEDLCSRLTDAFIDALASLEGVQRSPRKSGWRYQDEDQLRRALAKTNTMRHILTGRIGSSNEILTLGLRLYEHGGREPLWTGTFDGKTNEVIALQRRGLERLMVQLRLKPTREEWLRIDTLLTNNLEALGWYRQAVAVYTRMAGTEAGYLQVRALAQKALDLDPLYVDAEAYDVHMIRNLAQDRSPVHTWHDVYKGMEAVLQKDDTFAGALNQLAGYYLFCKRDWARSAAFWRRELQSDSPQVRLGSRAFWYRFHGWFEEARLDQEQSEHPEPTDPDARFFMAASRWVERRYAEGAQVARHTLELYPGHAEGYFWLAHCLVAGGQYEEGLQAIEQAQKDWKKQEMTALKAFAYARMGQPVKARAVVNELLELEHTIPYLQPYFVARVYAALGEKSKALDCLEQAEIDGSEYLLFSDLGGLRTDLAWDNLQDEPRFKALLKKVGLDIWPRPKS